MEETSLYYNLRLNRNLRVNPSQSQGVQMKEIVVAEELLTFNILIFDINGVDSNSTETIWERRYAKIR